MNWVCKCPMCSYTEVNSLSDICIYCIKHYDLEINEGTSLEFLRWQ